jgi:hypothetical protein
MADLSQEEFETLVADNQRRLGELNARGVILPLDSQYLIFLVEQMLSPAILQGVKEKYQQWARDQIGNVEAKIRQAAITAPLNGATPPLAGNRNQRRHTS